MPKFMIYDRLILLILPRTIQLGREIPEEQIEKGLRAV